MRGVWAHKLVIVLFEALIHVHEAQKYLSSRATTAKFALESTEIEIPKTPSKTPETLY